MRPDLYIEGRKGEMLVLFEVKASSDTQSWFTALGQLVVYGAHQHIAPVRFLVCPVSRQDGNFIRSLDILSIKVLVYDRVNGKYLFPHLGRLKMEFAELLE